MSVLLIHATTVFMGFFAIMNPIANVPIFLSITANTDQKTTKAVAFRSLMLAFVITAIFAVAGKLIFILFGITLPALRIAGGLLGSLIGLHMLQGTQSLLHHPGEAQPNTSREEALSAAASPLGMPISRVRAPSRRR